MAGRLQDVIQRDTRANQPAATTVPEGTIYYVTDENVTERSTGAAWEDISDGGSSGISELTGDVTAGPGAGSQAATIAAGAVTNAKAADMAQATIKGRAAAAGTGDPTDLTPDQASTILDAATDPFVRTSAAGAGGITELTGAVTAGPGSGSQAAAIADEAVTYAKMQHVSAESKLLGRGAGSGAGDVQEVTLGTNLSMSGTTLNAAGGAGDWDLEAVQAMDQDVTNSTTFTSSTDMVLALSASSYLIEVICAYSGDATTTDFKMQLIHDAGGNVLQWFGFRQGVNAAELVDGAFFGATTGAQIPQGGAGIQWGTLAAHAPRTGSIRGTVTFSSAGNLTLQFANVTGGVGAVSRLKAGSIIRAKEIA